MSRTATGCIDPSFLPARTRQEQDVFDQVMRQGLALHRLHADTRAVRVTGPGVHITAEGLHWIKVRDFEPFNSEVSHGRT